MRNTSQLPIQSMPPSIELDDMNEASFDLAKRRRTASQDGEIIFDNTFQLNLGLGGESANHYSSMQPVSIQWQSSIPKESMNTYDNDNDYDYDKLINILLQIDFHPFKLLLHNNLIYSPSNTSIPFHHLFKHPYLKFLFHHNYHNLLSLNQSILPIKFNHQEYMNQSIPVHFQFPLLPILLLLLIIIITITIITIIIPIIIMSIPIQSLLPFQLNKTQIQTSIQTQTNHLLKPFSFHQYFKFIFTLYYVLLPLFVNKHFLYNMFKNNIVEEFQILLHFL